MFCVCVFVCLLWFSRCGVWVWCEVDGDEVFVLRCVFLGVFVLKPAYSVCDVDGSVGD